ncbi:uncharacterized protein B0I36DRAFT_364648 [Microdochium trichocladiopsis]|uniref:SprT-like domain-containing protein n=1 Tax=Microdochium trichocladiopsis TaxID=1682393 RepID=A0A9P8Y0B1_9PEZI|nr:uncharacterized protein B0I36DRAFT_364648 [Microdochium trichocladiopsis]KAH7027448.1 hypothetical protein B0I36DRAFT_364648 [Microdochium trichocladiopsis]
MSRSSSGLSSPGEISYDYGLPDQIFFEGGKRRISITSRYGPEDDDAEPSLTKSKWARHVVYPEVFVENIPPFYILREDSSSPAPLSANSRGLHSGSQQGHDAQQQESYFSAVYQAEYDNTTRPARKDRRSKQASTLPACSPKDRFDDGDDHMSDAAAADSVERHVAENHKRNRHSKHERILKSLIRPKARSADFEIDDEAIQGIFYAANEFFFCGRLKGRVTWEWSDKCHSRFQTNIIGTTALRKASNIGGYETLIILSSHFLRDKNYSRRLLISTFLHELVHSYLFICCGFKARASGGHTDGFMRIASLIDNWAGPETLHLKNIEADLDDFLADAATYLHEQPLRTSYCSGHTSETPPSRVNAAPEWLPADFLHSYDSRSASPDTTVMESREQRHRTNVSVDAEPTFIILPTKRPEPIWHYEGPIDYRHNRLA